LKLYLSFTDKIQILNLSKKVSARAFFVEYVFSKNPAKARTDLACLRDVLLSFHPFSYSLHENKD